MRTIETIAELRHQVHTARGRGERIGFVATMGALHSGHASLIRTAHAQCDFVIASSFVNPLQFESGADLAAYPRTPEVDAEVAAAAGADLLWTPAARELYPDGGTVTVSVGRIGEVLEGRDRPGHFDGMATVVTKLLGAVQPDLAYFGEKDYQQLVIVRRLVAELNIPVEIRPVSTVRDPDGLALSSRNVRLSPAARADALALSAALAAAGELVATGETSAGRIRARAEVALAEAASADVAYVELVDPDTLDPVDSLEQPARLLVAARIDGIRLIDNALLEPVRADAASGDAAPSDHEIEGAAR